MSFWKYRKQAYFTSWGSLYEEVLYFFVHAKNVINFEKNTVVKKAWAKTASECNSMLHLGKKILKKAHDNYKNNKKVRAILTVNTEAQHIVYVI